MKNKKKKKIGGAKHAKQKKTDLKKQKKKIKGGRVGAKARRGGKKAVFSDKSLAVIDELVERGRPRGFVTDNEILYYFPKIENDVKLLEDIYERLEKDNVKIIETGGLIDVYKGDKGSAKLEKALGFERETPDAVQVYLKEIGRTPLLTKDEEKELAKKILKGDEEARQKLMKSNLRLVVSIAKRYANRTPNL